MIPTVAVTRAIAAEASDAWELISSTAGWPSWGPSVTEVEPAAETLSLGLRGRVRTPLGVWLPFRVTRWEPPHEWAWAVLGVPATSHTVRPREGGCEVGFAVPVTAIAYLPVCRVALARIADSLERRVSR